jgi:hypothetical protein
VLCIAAVSVMSRRRKVRKGKNKPSPREQFEGGSLLYPAGRTRQMPSPLSQRQSQGPDKQSGMLRDRISSAALWRALRCATATSVPALIGALTGNGDFGWAALGGFEAVFADLGGSYQARFTAMGLLSVGGAAGLFLGMISSGHVWCFSAPSSGVFSGHMPASSAERSARSTRW